jgi:acyl-CoA synthetase (AMP-forming)/AMP-acid ligase II
MTVNLTQGLHRAVQQKPNGVATIFGARRRTFAELVTRVAKLAGALQGLGMKPGDRVGILALNSDRYLEYYLGVLWGGGVVNPCNIRWSPKEILYSLEDCDTRILLIDDTFLKMREAFKGSRVVTTLVHMGDGEAPAGLHSYERLVAAAAPVEDLRRSGDDLAGIFYTGGTTGVAKGVMLTHANLHASAIAGVAAIPFGDDLSMLHAAPMFHLADIGLGLMMLLRGATHVFIPMFTPKGVLEAIQEAKVTTALLVPTMIQLVLDAPELGSYRTDSLTTLVYGASPITEAVLARAVKAWPRARLYQAYGMTELSPVASILPAERHVFEGPLAGKVRSAGTAALCVELKVVDAEDREVPRGTVGEVVVRGPNVMKGYWNKPELTEQSLRGGWMHTGDGAFMDDDGFLFIVDRLKDMIVTGGENVYSGEVENALMQHPGVAMCAVIAVPDPRWGERVHAVVVARPGQTLAAEALLEHCKGLIAGYKCPGSIEFRTELPVSGAGKILKTTLREPFWRGVERRVG